MCLARIDLIPGSKGSGKSALYRIFVSFLPDILLKQRKVIVAHGVDNPGDPVFQVFKNQFEVLSESEFIDFWCIYMVSLAHEQFLKNPKYTEYLKECGTEIEQFKSLSVRAGIPEVTSKKTLRDILGWVLEALRRIRPAVTVETGDLKYKYGIEIAEGSKPASVSRVGADELPKLPQHVNRLKESLETILSTSGLRLWLMVDRLDELFPRRSDVESRALRSLLKVLPLFGSPAIRVKIFMRDDIIDQITQTSDGFTGLTHVTARASDTLRWSEQDILQLIVKRVYASAAVRDAFKVDSETLIANAAYREEAFYKVFPKTVYSGPNQSPTLSWIYTHAMDGRGNVTPRDVIDLLLRARQHQLDEFRSNLNGTSDYMIGPNAIVYGFRELSKRKRETFLMAEFPHFWGYIEKFIRGKTEYTEEAILDLLGIKDRKVVQSLIGIGFLREKKGTRNLVIPQLYRAGLELTQGKAT